MPTVHLFRVTRLLPHLEACLGSGPQVGPLLANVVRADQEDRVRVARHVAVDQADDRQYRLCMRAQGP